MNCWPIAPTTNPTIDFASPPIPNHTDRERILNETCGAACEHPRHWPIRQCDVHHHNKDQIEGRGSVSQESRQSGLRRERDRDRSQHPDGFHSNACVPGPATGSLSPEPDGAVTTSTASSDEKSTAGRSMMAPKAPAPLSTDSIRPTTNPLG